MLEHARAASPDDACGILAGTGNRVERFYPTANREASPVHYRVDPVEQFRILRELEGYGWRVVGIFHSHPEESARPSPEDIAMAYYPDACYLILSLGDPNQPELRGFWIREGEVDEEEIHLV